MRNVIPCPSPTGHNYERLYIVRGEPRMAMDAEMQSGGNGDLADNIRQLLAGKLDDADIEMLITLISGGSRGAQDRRRRLMAGDAAGLQRHVQSSLARRAQTDTASLLRRFPQAARMRVV
jgi:hypothetical protein